MINDNDNDNRVYKKIAFELEVEDLGGLRYYPPVGWEGVWAILLHDGLFQVDNIPFYIRGISSGDIISTEVIAGELRFKELIRPSGHSTVRVFVSHQEDLEKLRQSLRGLGCSIEGVTPHLIAVDIPLAVSFEAVIAILAKGEKAGLWEYEEAAIYHKN